MLPTVLGHTQGLRTASNSPSRSNGSLKCKSGKPKRLPDSLKRWGSCMCGLRRIGPRPKGIAERFVRTLKEWLETHSWNSPEELVALLAEFLEYCNERPHQGAESDGLSPNEFARRLANCST